MFFLKSLDVERVEVFKGDVEHALEKFYRGLSSLYPIDRNSLYFVSDKLCDISNNVTIKLNTYNKKEFSGGSISTLIRYMSTQCDFVSYLKNENNSKKIILNMSDLIVMREELENNIVNVKNSIWNDILRSKMISNGKQNFAQSGHEMVLIYKELIMFIQEAIILNRIVVLYYE